MPMMYQDPPPIVRPAEKDVDLGQNVAAPMNREVREAANGLRQLLNLPLEPEYLPLVQRAAEQLAKIIEQEATGRNQRQVSFHPVGRAIGSYQFSDGRLSLVTIGEESAVGVVCKLLHISDPGLLTAEHVIELRTANKGGSERTLRVLAKLEEALRSDLKGDLSAITFPRSEIIRASRGDEAMIRARTDTVAAQLAASVIAYAESATEIKGEIDLAHWKQTRDRLEASALFSSASGLRWKTATDTTKIILDASLGRSSLLPLTPADVQIEIKAYGELAQRAVDLHQRLSDAYAESTFTAADKAAITKVAEDSRAIFLTTRREASLACAWVNSAARELSPALDAYRAAALYGDALSAEHPEWQATKIYIHDQVRALVVREVSAEGRVPESSKLHAIEEKLTTVLPRGEAHLVLAEAVAATKAGVLTQPLSRERTEQVRSLEALEIGMYRRAVSALGIESSSLAVTREQAEILSFSERVCAIQSLCGILRDGLERHSKEIRNNAESALRTLIDAEPQPAQRKELEIAVLTTLAPFVIERTGEFISSSALLDPVVNTPVGKGVPSELAVRQALIDYLSSEYTRLSHKVERLTIAVRALPDGESLRSALPTELSKSQELASRCSVALNEGLAHGVVHARNTEEKVRLFDQLAQSNERTRSAELAALQDFRKERITVQNELAEIERNSTEAAATRRAVLTGKLTILDAQIERWSRSVVLTSVYEAKVALQAEDPTLSRRAQDTIGAIPESVRGDPAVERIFASFKDDHQSSSQLLAGCKQFLYESVRDRPLTTFAYMIGLGLLGAAGAAAIRRGPGQGFLLASSATLGATKLYCLTTGFERIRAAYDTALTFSTPLSAGLDGLYLFNDVAQAYLLLGAYRALKSAQDSGVTLRLPKLKELPAAALSELGSFLKLGASQLDPRSLGFYLIGTPVGLGTYQIFTSGLRPEEQMVQLGALAAEVAPILAIALLHDRIKLNLDGGKKQSEEEEALPSRPALME